MTGRFRVAIVWAMGTAAAFAQADRWTEFINRGTTAELAGDYAAAAAAYREASTAAEGFDRTDARRVFAFNAEAMMLDAMGRFTDAEGAYRKALAVMDLAGGPPTLNRAVLLANLANVLLETGQTGRAEKLLRESIAIHTTAEAPHEVRLALARNTLAEFLTVTGRHDEAAAWLDTSIPVLEKHPEAGPELGSALNNLGAVRLYQGRPADARPLLERSLSILEAARGVNHPVVLRTLYNLAVARQMTGQREAAGETWRRAIDLATSSVGLEHPLYGEILAGYASYLQSTGKKAQAKVLAARSSAILRDHQRRNGIGGVVDVTSLQQRSK